MHKFCFILVLLVSLNISGARAAMYGQDTTVTIQQSDEQYVADSTYGSTQNDQDTTLHFSHLSLAADSINAWKKDKAFAYATYLDSLLKAEQKKRVPANVQPEQSGPSWLDSVFASPVTRVFFWTLAGIFILFIFYRLFLTEGVFRKSTRNIQVPATNVEEETMMGETDFESRISQAILSGNYRLAVRYQYLMTLQKLAAGHFIELSLDKTNYQYVREIANKANQSEFASLTLSYEYVWYGEFLIEEGVYLKIASRFSGFNQKIGS